MHHTTSGAEPLFQVVVSVISRGAVSAEVMSALM